MRLKKMCALLLAGVMMVGGRGVMSPMQVKAATSSNVYTMTVPADMAIQNSGWNSLGNIGITGPVDSNKKVTVTATTANGFALKSGENSVSYTMKTASTDTAAKTSFEFDAASINAAAGASQAIGVDVEDFSGKAAGTYTDTITFTGVMSDTGSGTGGETEVSADAILGDGMVTLEMEGWIFDMTKSGETFTCKRVVNTSNGRDYTSSYAQMCSASIADGVYTFIMENYRCVINTNTKVIEQPIGLPLVKLYFNNVEITELYDIE